MADSAGYRVTSTEVDRGDRLVELQTESPIVELLGNSVEGGTGGRGRDVRRGRRRVGGRAGRLFPAPQQEVSAPVIPYQPALLLAAQYPGTRASLVGRSGLLPITPDTPLPRPAPQQQAGHTEGTPVTSLD